MPFAVSPAPSFLWRRVAHRGHTLPFPSLPASLDTLPPSFSWRRTAHHPLTSTRSRRVYLLPRVLVGTRRCRGRRCTRTCLRTSSTPSGCPRGAGAPPLGGTNGDLLHHGHVPARWMILVARICVCGNSAGEGNGGGGAWVETIVASYMAHVEKRRRYHTTNKPLVRTPQTPADTTLLYCHV